MTYSVSKVQEILVKLYEEDQKILYDETSTAQAFEEHSQKCFHIMKEVVSQYGGISISSFGEKASNQAWLLVQHMDQFVEFQEEYLNLMLDSIFDYHASNIAYLSDRVLVNKGKKQIYGTQFMNSGNGVYKPRPTIDPKNVNQRRYEVGLQSIEDYANYGWKKVDWTGFYDS